jgi:hypothetical protein
MTAAYAIFAIIFAFTAFQLWKLRKERAREYHIRTFSFPRGIFAKVINKYPHLTQKDMELVGQGLRQFFMAYQKSGHQYISMPSQVADELWHEFILYTKNYQEFTKHAFGVFLHHTPAIVLSQKAQRNIGLRRCWRHACLEEHINPIKPSRLPLLFALDVKLKIGDGYHYVADCSGLRQEQGEGGSTIYCGGDFSDNSIDGGTDGLSDSSGEGNHAGHHGGDAHSSSSDGSGGGDGGCGGGCGGGGD